jgi:hypothetical protein
MISTLCRNCGARVRKWAAACSRCGAPNPARRRFVVVAALSLVLLAVVGAALVVLANGVLSRREPAAIQGADGNYAWLETAMKQCDAQAASNAKGLHYLVTPLIDEPRDDTGWRRISINDIGNAILIKSVDMLAGLRRKALRISGDEYVFSARNEKTKDILTWKPSKGVRKFVINEASDIEEFKIQFQSTDAARAINWGASFVRQPGNCYWVNAILR